MCVCICSHFGPRDVERKPFIWCQKGQSRGFAGAAICNSDANVCASPGLLLILLPFNDKAVFVLVSSWLNFFFSCGKGRGEESCST